MALIGLSGKKQSGKDLTCKIINYLVNEYKKHGQRVATYDEFLKFSEGYSKFPNEVYIPYYQRKLFADKLKDIVCLLIGCTRTQLEDNDFKEKELGEEWNVGNLTNMVQCNNCGDVRDSLPFGTLTPRTLLQLIGTDCGRNLIHPNIWVNALMSDYKPVTTQFNDRGVYFKDGVMEEGWYVPEGHRSLKEDKRPIKLSTPNFVWSELAFPNWIITDCRFPNELKAIEDKGGVVIRINRNWAGEIRKEDTHPSETSLDTHQFQYIINNDGTIEQLIEMVEQILLKLKII